MAFFAHHDGSQNELCSFHDLVWQEFQSMKQTSSWNCSGGLLRGDALMMHWWCINDALMIDNALTMCSWCADDICADNALMMCWWCPVDALMMQWWCTEYDLMHKGQVSDLHWKFYGGRINGDKTWRRQPTNRVNIEQYASRRWIGRVLQLLVFIVWYFGSWLWNAFDHGGNKLIVAMNSVDHVVMADIFMSSWMLSWPLRDNDALLMLKN